MFFYCYCHKCVVLQVAVTKLVDDHVLFFMYRYVLFFPVGLPDVFFHVADNICAVFQVTVKNVSLIHLLPYISDPPSHEPQISSASFLS